MTVNPTEPLTMPDGKSLPPLFTDFTHDNIGVPSNRAHPLAQAEPDLGIGKVLNDARENGKFKVMSLRNIQRTKPYGHNGFFMSLDEITHFYNTRDVASEGWADPEYTATVNDTELGNLGLSAKDEDALVKFMKALTDGYKVD